MALTTRCPQCGTSFKVVPDQLRVRNGLVRCGACSTVFDGRACLLPEPGGPVPPAAPAGAPLPSSAAAAAAPVLVAPAAPIAPVTAQPAAVPPAVLRTRDDIRGRVEPDAALPEDENDDAEEGGDEGDAFRHAPAPIRAAPAAPPSPPRAEPMVARRGGEPLADWGARRGAAAQQAEPSFADAGARRREAPEPDPRHEDVRDAERDDEYEDELDSEGLREPVLGDARTRYSSATDVGRAPPEFLDQDREERRGLWRKLWGYACLVGLIAFGLQLLYAYRTDIANSVPALRPVLETACQPLGCTVGYARRLERIAISSSSLQPPTGAAAIDDGRSRLVLNLVLRNRYDKPQHWPALVLDLTDLSDTVVVRKVLMPENYLTPEQLRGPFGAAGELKISVPIEVTGVQVNGYQLDKFFP